MLAVQMTVKAAWPNAPKRAGAGLSSVSELAGLILISALKPLSAQI
jgi:hypothetical protein